MAIVSIMVYLTFMGLDKSISYETELVTSLQAKANETMVARKATYAIFGSAGSEGDAISIFSWLVTPTPGFLINTDEKKIKVELQKLHSDCDNARSEVFLRTREAKLLEAELIIATTASERESWTMCDTKTIIQYEEYPANIAEDVVSIEFFDITPRPGFTININSLDISFKELKKGCHGSYARLESVAPEKFTVKNFVQAKEENNAECQLRVTAKYNENLNILHFFR